MTRDLEATLMRALRQCAYHVMRCVLTAMDSVRNSVQKETESTYGAGGRAERVRERREMIWVN